MTNLNRALNLFAAMDSIPDEYVCSAEETFSKAETGASRPAKSMEALRDAQQLVIRNQNMQIDQQHLLYALLNQEGGLDELEE